MQLRVGFDIRFLVPAPTAAILLLHVYPERYHFVQPERLTIFPRVPSDSFRDNFGNGATRVLAPPGVLTLSSDAIVEIDGQLDPADLSATQTALAELPLETLPFLFSSRYCEVDRLSDFAWATFGNGPTGYPRVQAICAYVHDHIRFDYTQASPFKTACDVFHERQGVCRDFAHLAITLCRCMGMPARYATGYLPDIDVPVDPSPMDFCAWFEVFLSGRWFTFDARHNARRKGRVVMAYGRDAVDAALTSSFGPITLQHFQVWANQV